jgi:hypothetical protein
MAPLITDSPFKGQIFDGTRSSIAGDKDSQPLSEAAGLPDSLSRTRHEFARPVCGVKTGLSKTRGSLMLGRDFGAEEIFLRVREFLLEKMKILSILDTNKRPPIRSGLFFAN